MFDKIVQFMGIKRTSEDKFVSRSILVVDDNETDLILVQRAVEKMGHRVLTAKDGETGFQIAKAEKPDLILSDCRMPEMSGVEMFKRIKEAPETRNIPLVFLTGADTPAMVIECFDVGADNYMCKPINAKLLTAQIKTIFEEYLAS